MNKNRITLSELSTTELQILYKDGNIGSVTRYIDELSFFFNAVEEEIKRRNLKEKGSN